MNPRLVLATVLMAYAIGQLLVSIGSALIKSRHEENPLQRVFTVLLISGAVGFPIAQAILNVSPEE